METMESQFEKLDEAIKDDDKIVTVASFAIMANISFNESQKVIDKYVEVHKESKEIYPTYILNGSKKDTDKFSVVQVSDQTLDDEKHLYKDNHSVIIFSIQKAKCIDYNIISLVETASDPKRNNLSGAIVGKNCVKRVLQKKILPPLPAATIRGKSTVFTKFNSSVKSEVKSEEKIKVEKNEPIQENNKLKVNAQGSIAGMFDNAAKNKKIDTKQDKSKFQNPKENGKLSNFFAKKISNEVLSEELKNKAIKIESNEFQSDLTPKKEEKKTDLFDSDTDDEILKDLDIHEKKTIESKAEINKEKSKSNQNKNNTSQKKKKRGKADVGNDKSVKKRKRIIVEDSDSDDIFGSEKSDSEDILEKHHEEPEPIKVETKSPLPKNKRRKAVKKTYEDEEGFIVTQTEYVYETASEDENEPDNKVPKKEEESKPKLEKKSINKLENKISQKNVAKNKKGAKKTSPGNQPTLMSFFKRA